ncbi:MAG: hypothetical protein ABJA87_01445 [bacterium]
MTDDQNPATPEVSVGMATGSDTGAPGEHLPEPPLGDDERRLLSALQEPNSTEPLVAVEDSPRMVNAAEDDAPLPSDIQTPGAQSSDADEDPDRPAFYAPED